MSVYSRKTVEPKADWTLRIPPFSGVTGRTRDPNGAGSFGFALRISTSSVLPSLAGLSFRTYGICLDYRVRRRCCAAGRTGDRYRHPVFSYGAIKTTDAAVHDGARRLLDPGMKSHRTDNVPREQRGQDRPQTKNPHRHHAHNRSRARSESEYPEVSALRLRFSWEFDGSSRVRLSAERCFHATPRVSRTLSNILSS